MTRTHRQGPSHDIQTLRASLDSRLAALEDALANPAKHASLESLLLDLARAATEEAEASARQAVLEAQRDAAAARGEAASALEAGKAEASGTRRELESALASVEQERRRAAGLEKAVDQYRSELQAGRAAIEAQQREIAAKLQEFATRHQALENQFRDEQAAHARSRAQIDLVRAEADAERKSADRLLETNARLERELDAARVETADLRRDLDLQRRELDAVQQEAAARTETLSQSHAEREIALRAAQDALGAAEARIGEMQHERDRALGELADLRQELDSARRDADARLESLSHSTSEQETALKAAREAAEAADARAGDMLRERDAALAELVDLRRELDLVRREANARTETMEQSDAERERALRAVEAATRAAEAQAEQALLDRDALKAELQLAQDIIREKDVMIRELEASHEQRDAARGMRVFGVPAGFEHDDDEETVVDLTTETKDEEMQSALERRVRSLELALRDAESRAESAELELELQKQAAGRPSAFSAFEIPEESAAAEPSAPDAPKEPVFRGPARGAKRVPITSDVAIQIDAAPGKLIDLSITGAQVLTSFSMKPNRLVKVSLPFDDSLIACKAKVMWSRLEPKAGELLYRAGVLFTSADQEALEVFLSRHRKDG